MRIASLDKDDTSQITQAASLLVKCFQGSWAEEADAVEEVLESLLPGRISLVAIGDSGDVLGWVGGKPQYNGRVWELHPLAVLEEHRRKGIGRALVVALEAEAVARGGITMILGTDDEDARTTLGGVDIYQDLLNKIKNIRNLYNHPFEFYIKLGYTIVGVIPDANGWGKPDILMAKRITPIPAN